MARRDHSEEDDFYTQDFRRSGVVSIWIGLSDVSAGLDADVLQDLCGVGYYSLDDQEGYHFDNEFVDVRDLLGALSYSFSFKEAATAKASSMGLRQARWTTAQYDFAYAPEKIRRPIAEDPVFVGVFTYRTEERRDA